MGLHAAKGYPGAHLLDGLRERGRAVALVQERIHLDSKAVWRGLPCKVLIPRKP